MEGMSIFGKSLWHAIPCSLQSQKDRREEYSSSLSTLSWRGRKTGKIGIHLTENGSNQRHVILDGR